MTDWQDIHNETDALIAKLHGIATVLDSVAWDFGGLNCPDLYASGILTMIGIIRKELEALGDMHRLEREAILAGDSR